MSINLHLEDTSGRKRKSVSLWQTPTWVTNICLSLDASGQPHGGMPAVRERYIIWVESHSDGVWKSSEDLGFMRDRIREHVAEVRAVNSPWFSAG